MPKKEGFIRSIDFIHLCKSLLLISESALELSVDFHQFLLESLEELYYLVPRGVVFADTNWFRPSFAFQVNPGTEELELWLMDAYGHEGEPLSQWNEVLNGSKTAHWGAYVHPLGNKEV